MLGAKIHTINENKSIGYYFFGANSKTPLSITFKTEDFERSYDFLPNKKTLKDLLNLAFPGIKITKSYNITSISFKDIKFYNHSINQKILTEFLSLISHDNIRPNSLERTPSNQYDMYIYDLNSHYIINLLCVYRSIKGIYARISVLWLAIMRGQLELAEHLIAQGADIHATATNGTYAGISILSWAVKNGQSKLAERLIAQGADIHATPTTGPYSGISVLWWAVKNGQSELAERLIAQGTDIHATATNGTYAGISVLWWAVKNGQSELAERLIAQGADIHATATTGHNAGISVLFLAVMNGHLELAERLIAQGADINATATTGPYAGISVLWLAVMNRHLELAEHLIAQGADIDATVTTGTYAGISVLLLAVMNGHLELAEHLIAQGADIHATAPAGPNAGITVLFLAVLNGHLELAERLIAQGADINATLTTGDTAGTSVLLLAVMNDYLEIAELLIAKGADIHATFTTGDNAGMSVLWWAVKSGQLELAERLIAQGADIHATVSTGTYADISVLWWAVKNDHLELAERLIAQGADIHATPTTGPYSGISVLWWAVSNGQWELVKYLIEHGANIHATTTDEEFGDITILFLLAFHNKLNDILPLILAKNNSITTRTISEHAEKAKTIANYKLSAPSINSIYLHKDITGSRFNLAQTDQGFLYNAHKIFSHVCDDENAGLYDGEGFHVQLMCKYLINIGAFYQNQIKYKQISDVFTKAGHDLLALEDSFKCWNNIDKIRKIVKNEAQMLVIACPTNEHAMFAKLIRKNGFFLHIYNDGQGVVTSGEHNEMITDFWSSPQESYEYENEYEDEDVYRDEYEYEDVYKCKYKYAYAASYMFPIDVDTKRCYDSLINLLLPKIEMSTLDFYKELKKTTSSLNAIKFDNDLHFSTGQRSGTCSLKSMRAFLQGSMSRDEYLLHKFAINIATLNEYYNLATVSNKLSENMVAMQIIDVCNNIKRLEKKLLKFSVLLDDDTKQFIQKSIEIVTDIERKATDIKLRNVRATANPLLISPRILPLIFSAAVVSTIGITELIMNNKSRVVYRQSY